jgi:hypothetical protein
MKQKILADNISSVNKNEMLRKRADELKKTDAKRRHNKRVLESLSVFLETKEIAAPLSFAGFSTCFNFLKMPPFCSEVDSET